MTTTKFPARPARLRTSRRNRQVGTRFTADDHRAVAEAAQAAGLNVSVYVAAAATYAARHAIPLRQDGTLDGEETGRR